MAKTADGMHPIWYFVGWLLILIGSIVVLAGVVNLFMPLPNTTVVKGLHPNLWWGSILIVVGLVYVLKHRGVRLPVEHSASDDSGSVGEGGM